MKRFIPFLSCALIAACGGGDGGESAAGLIVATQGGTIQLADSETSITFPAGSLKEDTEVSLAEGSLADYAPHQGALSRVIVLGPAVSLETPASLNIDLDGQIEAGARLHIVQHTDGVWIRPEVSTLELGSGNIASASVFQLLPTAVVVEGVPGDTGRVEGEVLHIYTQEPLPGIELNIVANDMIVGTATSATNGSFSFDGVPLGPVVVNALLSAEDNCFSDPTSKEVTVVTGEAATVTFGFVPPPC